VAYLVAGDTVPTSAQLRAWLGKRLPVYMVPRLFMVLDALPLTPRAKVDRRALPEPEDMRSDSTREYVAPVGPVEELLAEIWSRVLDVDQVGRHDNFFDLGGDSIRNIQVVGQARSKGLVVGLPDLHRYPTVQTLAEAVEPRKATAPARARTSAFALLSDRDRELLAARKPSAAAGNGTSAGVR
jgi:aryl carrier-like protein